MEVPLRWTACDKTLVWINQVCSSLTICINKCMALVVQGRPQKILDHYLHLNLDMKQQLHFYLMLGLHYVPGSHGSPGSPKRSVP